MDLDIKKFGRGPKELTGAVDLISHYKLLPQYEYFCKKSLPLSISDSHYLHNVEGDTEIKKGEGMQLDQLILDSSFLREKNAPIRTFDLQLLREAFQLRETTPVDLPPSETRSGHDDSVAENSKKHHEKKRKHDGDEDINDIHKHKKSMHKSSKIDEMDAINCS